MRTSSAILGVSVAAIVTVGAVGCGNGDDASAPVPVDSGPDATKTEGGADAASGPQLKHIFYIMMENHGRSEIIGSTADGGTLLAPYITSLATQYGQATHYYGVTHPSLPNYLAAISGDFQGIFDDCKAGPDVLCDPEEFIPADDGGAGAGGDNSGQSLLTPAQSQAASLTPHWFRAPTIVDQLEAHGKTWVAYMESIPGAGDTSEYSPVDTDDAGMPVPRKLYAQKHDPFLYFESVRTSAARMKKIVPMTSFASDLAGGDSGPAVPNFVWISPNQCSDMHGVSSANAAAVGIMGCDVDSTAIGIGDKFVKDTVTTIMASPAWAEGAAIVIVWDEDDYSGTAGCCNSPKGLTGYLGGANVPAIVISSLVTGAVVSDDPYNHYALLGTIQKLWGLDCLANTCGMKGKQLMTQLFVPAAPSDAGGTPSGDAASEAGSSSEAGDAGSSDASDAGSSDASDAGKGSEASDAPTGG